jgi:hypothetical protein
MVEGLSSEIVGVAFEHRVTPADLVARELANFAEIPLKARRRSDGELRKYFGFFWSRSLNAWGKLTKGFVAALEASTLMHCFEALTLLPLEGSVTLRELLVSTRRWCPLCFEERRSKDQRPYEPLVWSLSVTTVCLVHEVDLVEICPGCLEKQLSFTGTTQPGYCTNCGHWLGMPGKEECTQGTSSALANAKRVGDLVCALPGYDKASLAETLNRNIFAIVDAETKGNFTHFRRVCGFEGSEFAGFPEERPHIDHLLRICETFELTLTDLFNSSFTTSKRSVGGSEPQKERPTSDDAVGTGPAGGTIRKPHKLTPEELTRARSILETALNESPAPKLRELARRVGWERGTIRRHFPELWNKLKSRAHPANIREQLRSLLLSLVPEAQNLTIADVERVVGLTYVQMCQRCPEEYRMLAGRLRRPSREAVDLRRGKLREFARDVAQRERETGVAISLRRALKELPADCLKATYEVSDALREARIELLLGSQSPDAL